MSTNHDRPATPGGPVVLPRRVDRDAFAREFPSGDASATECAQNLMRASSLFTDADTRAVAKHGLSIAARLLLATLEGAGEALSASTLAERLLITGASVTSLVDTLEKRGLVRRLRPGHDRRLVLVELTDAARPVVDAFLAEITTLHAAMFADLSEDEREQFIMLLARVSARIASLDPPAVAAAARPRRKRR